ncbi:hypothetical protein [Burkholderia sp. Ac-20344]|uniref:hypothetical protein n=1 Tax=Burkholderia sp. Ac-20344 TaxID=2703890 RepID=UPI00197C6365|nr:hypothetical protein [Burkholderia sp. Ac-20344]MBN3830806.1 hypothetical protein [Burkholderia sp. Ac-20344]
MNALEEVIRKVQAGLVTVDGCPLAGKSTASVQICERLGAIALELDQYVVRGQGEYVDALRTTDLLRSLSKALSGTSLGVLEGGCIREVLAILGVAARPHVYVQPISSSGILSNIEMLDAEDGKPPRSIGRAFF